LAALGGRIDVPAVLRKPPETVYPSHKPREPVNVKRFTRAMTVRRAHAALLTGASGSARICERHTVAHSGSSW
jgi:hypothetical protein